MIIGRNIENDEASMQSVEHLLPNRFIVKTNNSPSGDRDSKFVVKSPSINDMTSPKTIYLTIFKPHSSHKYLCVREKRNRCF